MARERRFRIRKHVNPLADRYSTARAEPVAVPAHLGPWPVVEVELGCAEGTFAFALARAFPERFVVGLDIRERIVEADQRRLTATTLRNLTFSYSNFGVDLDRVFERATVARFHLLFPDPWFKTRHHKRRVVDPGLLDVVRTQLVAGGELHVATDVFDVGLDALAVIEAHGGFANLLGPWSFARENPVPATSRRETKTLAGGRRVWRMRFRKV